MDSLHQAVLSVVLRLAALLLRILSFAVLPIAIMRYSAYKDVTRRMIEHIFTVHNLAGWVLLSPAHAKDGQDESN